MPLDIQWCPEVGKKIEEFFNDSSYKDYLENAVSFNRKLNEERKMRLPYIDGQTGVAQRHYNSMRSRRERMPPSADAVGQVYCYPQKPWHKKRYQYLKYYMQPKQRFDPEADMHTISQVENPSAVGSGQNSGQGMATPIGINEDSNHSAGGSAGGGGGGGSKDDSQGGYSYYENEYDDGSLMEDDFNSDSDFEFEDTTYGSRYKRKGNDRGKKKSKGSKGPGSTTKRRTHADNIPDSEKPFSCDLCGARYKTRPGLTYHVNHSHKDGAPSNASNSGMQGPPPPPPGSVPVPSSGVPSMPHHPLNHMGRAPVPVVIGGGAHGDDVVRDNQEGLPVPPPVGGTPLPTPPSTPSVMGGGQENPGDQPAGGRGSSRRSIGGVNYRESDSFTRDEDIPLAASHPERTPAKKTDSKGRAVSLGYCDFCLGDAAGNKKTGKPEELVACAECGRSGHPSCLQFTENMIISVKKYPWQCIECKCCTLCGTSENDDQLLFCDDCDRGYHMYCLKPPIKEPPEGSWSCNLCIETFHRKK